MPFYKIFNLLMDMQQSDIPSKACITTCLVLAKAAQRMTENPFDLRKRATHMPGLVLMDWVAGCGYPLFGKKMVYLN